MNGDGLREVFLADEMERDSRTVRFDVAPPKRCKSVGVIVSGITVITDAKQPTLQKPDDGGGHDTCAEWILAVFERCRVQPEGVAQEWPPRTAVMRANL